MAVILFDMFPAQGHYNGSLGLARLMKSAGHKVIYACPPDFQEKILTSGFHTYLFNPFIIMPAGLERKLKGLMRFVIENWAGIFTGAKGRRIDENISKYDEMVERIKPAIIILDEHYAYKSVFYWKYNVPVVTLQTAVSPDYSPGIPPFNVPVVPDFSIINMMYVEFLWKKHLWKNQWTKFLDKILLAGNTSGKYYRLYAEKYGFPFHRLLRRRVTGIRFANIPTLIVPPESFDFPRKVKNNLFYIGPLNHKLVQRDMVNQRLERVFEEVSEQKTRAPETRLVYCSLGTVTGNYLKGCRKFFRNISKVCRHNPDLHVVLSVGTYFDIAEIGETPGNLYVFDRVPQLEVLKKCDHVITHGGMNTIYESIMAEKPMIVFPLSMDWDQNGNAARVVYHGLGLKGVLRRANPRSIEKLLSLLTAHEQEFRTHIRSLKSKFKDKSAYTIDLMESFIKNHVSC